MAIKKKDEVTKTATAPKNAPKSDKGSGDGVLAQAGKGRWKELGIEEQQFVGSKAKDIEWIELLTNPYQPVPRGKVQGSESVGLLLKNVGDEPITVLEFKQLSKNVMDADYKHPTEKVVAPGDEFQVTWAEAGALAVRDEYNGYFLGSEDEKKRLRYTPATPKAGANYGIPTTKFILHGHKGSIADNAREIATPEEMERREVSPEFAEKFHVFAIKQSSTNGLSMKRNGVKVNAAALSVNSIFQQVIGGGNTEESAQAEEVQGE